MQIRDDHLAAQRVQFVRGSLCAPIASRRDLPFATSKPIEVTVQDDDEEGEMMRMYQS